MLLAARRRASRRADVDGANWCTYATWASKQAGRAIRGEDWLEQLGRRLGEGRWLLHPFAIARGAGCCAAACSSRRRGSAG